MDNASLLDDITFILQDTLSYLEQSQKKIYKITEVSRAKYYKIKDELAEIEQLITQLNERIEKSSSKDKESGNNPQAFKKIENGSLTMQLEVASLRGDEQKLRYKRDNLEQSLRRIKATLDKAENAISQFSMVLSYLNNETNNISLKPGEKQQQLGVTIFKAQEEERKRVAREIHDGPAQLLANIVMRAEYIQKLMEIKPYKVKNELINLQDLVRQSLQDVRKIIFDLRPMVLDDLGLVPAINRYVADYKKQHSIYAEFVFFGSQKRLPPATEVALFRVIQEALNNIYKHAQATQVLVKMEQLQNKINILIKDDGKGFDVNYIQQSNDRECYGLLNMYERVQLLQGEFKINSAPGKGTVITLTVPI